MTSTSARHNVVEAFIYENGIDPFEVLGIPMSATAKEIRRAYRRKARLLHPDKQPNGGAPEPNLEFVVLTACYEFAMDYKIPHRHLSEPDDDPQPLQQPLYRRGCVDHQAFEGAARNDLLNDGLDVEALQANLNKRGHSASLSQVYQANERIFNAFQGKSFDRKKFNALFEHLKDKYEFEGKAVITRPDEISPMALGGNTGGLASSSTAIVTYNGIMMVNQGHADYSTQGAVDRRLTKSLEAPQVAIDEILTEPQLERLVKQMEKDTGKIAKNKAKVLAQQKGEKVNVNHTLSFSEAERQYEQQQLRQTFEEMERNRQYIRRYGRAFDANTHRAAMMGRLPDSSTAVFPETPRITGTSSNSANGTAQPSVPELTIRIPSGRRTL